MLDSIYTMFKQKSIKKLKLPVKNDESYSEDQDAYFRLNTACVKRLERVRLFSYNRDKCYIGKGLLAIDRPVFIFVINNYS